MAPRWSMGAVHRAAGTIEPARMNQGLDMRVRDGARWSFFIVGSVALHAIFLLTPGSRGTRQPGLDTAFGSGPLEVRLSVSSIPATRRAVVESEWTPLQTLPQPSMRKPRLLDLIPADIESSWFDESAYLPISRLTLRPSPVTPVAVPYPLGVAAVASRTEKVVVFIDEDGTVAKVAFAGDQAPSPFASAAKKTFENVRFTPALVDGTPVKARIVIVVTFEDRAAKP
jgi:hypothetical protein